MKRIIILGVIALFCVTNAFALDLSSFTGTWKLSGKNGPSELNINLKNGILHIKGLLEDELKDVEILSKGETVFEEIPVSFSSGSYDDKTLIINIIFHFSKAKADTNDALKAPDNISATSLRINENSKKLKLQTLGIGFSSDKGLTPILESYSYDKQK